MKEFLKNSNTENTLLITDFDGTLYRGLFPCFFRGIANADLGIVFLLLNFLNIRNFVRLFVNIFRLWRLELHLHRDYKSGEISLSSLDEQLIRFFAANILSFCSKKDIKRAAGMLCCLCYKNAWQCLSSLKGKCAFVILSKSFEFLLKKVERTASENYGIKVEVYGVKIGPNGIVTDSVISREEKYRKVRELLKKNPQIQKAMIFGDTEDDIAMRDAAVEVLGNAKVLFISVNPKDEKVIEASDKSFRSWKEVNLFMKNTLS